MGEQKGKLEGLREARLIAARSMLADGMSVLVVSKYTGIPTAELKNLVKDSEE
jgi:predicted transposase YdaD